MIQSPRQTLKGTYRTLHSTKQAGREKRREAMSHVMSQGQLLGVCCEGGDEIVMGSWPGDCRVGEGDRELGTDAQGGSIAIPNRDHVCAELPLQRVALAHLAAPWPPHQPFPG